MAPEVHAETFAVGEAVSEALRAVGRRRINETDPERIMALLRIARRAMQRALGITPEEDAPGDAVSKIEQSHDDKSAV